MQVRCSVGVLVKAAAVIFVSGLLIGLLGGAEASSSHRDGSPGPGSTHGSSHEIHMPGKEVQPWRLTARSAS